MKYILYLFPALIVGLAALPAMAAGGNAFPPAEVMVLAANNALELDVTMEMVDEDAESSSDIINVIELPVQEMHQEQIRNQRRIRLNSENVSPLHQDQESAASIWGEINSQISEAQQEAEEAKREASGDLGGGQNKGQ